MNSRLPTTLLLTMLVTVLILTDVRISAAEAFQVFAATHAADEEDLTFNALSWPLAELESPDQLEGFSVYRKVDPQAPYPQFPLHFTPLVVMKSCAAIQTIIPEGSLEWELVEEALAEGSSGFGGLVPLELGFQGGGFQDAGGGAGIQGLQILPPTEPSDPCDLWKFDPDSDAFGRVRLVAQRFWKVAQVLGRAYRDDVVVEGTTYYYELTALVGGEEILLATDIEITAGQPNPPSAPTDLTALAGDSQVLVHWSQQLDAVGFDVYRATASDGPYQLINDANVTAKLTQDLDGELLFEDNSEVDGFLDFQRWTPSGLPKSHTVEGDLVAGPKDGTTYFYKVAGTDLLGQPGLLTDPVDATPQDTTPPAVPTEVTVIPDDGEDRIEVRWAKVLGDTDGHREQGIQGYRVWRRDQPFATEDNLELVSALIPQPPKGSTLVVFTDDHNPPGNALRPQYGEKRLWYHVECIDAAANESHLSAGIVGHLKDVTPPAPPKNVEAEGFDAFIRVTWGPISELDDEGDETIAGYHIYRSLCDLGEWACFRREEPDHDPADRGSNDPRDSVPSGQPLGDSTRDPNFQDPNTTGLDANGTPSHNPKDTERRCEVTFDFLGFVSQEDAMAGDALWDDHTVPPGSPLCYAYLVKTVDEAQNESGSWPPDPDVETIVCQRLRDKTPPKPAIVSGLHARDAGVLVEWIGPPVQDLKAYHVYRSESEDAGYAWIGGRTVLPPGSLDAPYKPQLSGCEEIPLELFDDMSSGAFLDTMVPAKQIYYYKVVGVDQVGNEAPLDGAIPVGTFTFTTATPSAPTLSVAPQDEPCGNSVTWSPALDAGLEHGYALYRSDSAAGPFIQIGGTLLEANEYFDTRVARGTTYYYRVAVLGHDGKLSLSNTGSGQVN